MNLLLVIDHFGPGGAQRQIVELACGLKRRGHHVEMFVYFPEHKFFRPLVDEQGIVVHEYAKGRGFSFGVLLKLSRLVRHHRFDVVLSFLRSANVYAELALLMSEDAKLVVSERTSHHDDRSFLADHLRRILHALADKVVANSHAHRAWLSRKWWLKTKATCIYNGVDLNEFCPGGTISETTGNVRLIGVGRIGPEKNILNLIAAMAILQASTGNAPQISWAGSRDESDRGQRYCRKIDQALEALPETRRRWHWLGVQSDVPGLLRRHDALVHPSLYEGLPNAVCEALACGIPVLASDVCDHPLLVTEGERGFLFDPESPQSIAAAVATFTKVSLNERRRLSRNAREYAEATLGVDQMVTAYERLLSGLLGTKRPSDVMAC